MQALKDLLPAKKLDQYGLCAKVIDDQTIFYVCKRVLVEEYGARGGENITPVYYKEKEKRLLLSPRSSLWASEAHMRRAHIMKRINELLGSEVLAEVKVTSHF